jgi:hypothetical protein
MFSLEPFQGFCFHVDSSLARDFEPSKIRISLILEKEDNYMKII